MSHVNTVLNQLLQLLPRHQFDTLVKMHGGDRYVKGFTCWRQLITLLYAQCKGHDSLRDIETGLTAQHGKWYHLGLTGVARSTLSDANGNRDWRIFEGLFYHLLARCKSLTPKHKFQFKNPLYALDSTTISLCLSAYPWARFRTTKGALKMHCLLDHSGCIPSFLTVTDGKRHDVAAAKQADLPLSPDSIVAIDRGYVDFSFLHSLHTQGVFFVTRAKDNMQFEETGQQKLPNKKGLIDDLTIHLTGQKSRKAYPDALRYIIWHDEDSGRLFSFLTNNFTLAASTIAAIYKARWQIEIFFKWVKQNLKIKSFLGTSPNAVFTQIWVAMCYFLLLSYVKYQTRYRYSLTSLAHVVKEILMERVCLLDALSLRPDQAVKKAREPDLQLVLF